MEVKSHTTENELNSPPQQTWGGGERALMTLAGHSNMATSQRYTDLRPTMIKACVELV